MFAKYLYGSSALRCDEWCVLDKHWACVVLTHVTRAARCTHYRPVQKKSSKLTFAALLSALDNKNRSFGVGVV